MGARILRAGGAASLVAGAVLMVSGAAWSDQNQPVVPGTPPVSGVLDRALDVPGAALSPPAHDDSPGPRTQAEAAGPDDPDAQGASESRDAYITRTCERVLGQPPTGGLDKATEPAAGTTVAPGDEISVSVTWDPADWSGESLHKAIDCVTVNDVLTLGLTVEERPTDNDGTFEPTYIIPVDVVAGDEICDQGFLSGDSSGGGFDHSLSNQVCFTVEQPEGTTSSAPVETPPPDSRVPAAPAPTPAAPPATDVLGEQMTAPVETVAPAPEAGPVLLAGPPVPEVLGATLPRTGAETRRGPMLAAGVILSLGGFGLMGGTRRPRRPARGPV